MTEVEIQVTGAFAKAKVSGKITAGMAGCKVHVKLDKQWEGLSPILVAKSDGVAMPMLISPDGWSEIPHERCVGGARLLVGIDGRSQNGAVRIPTVWADCGIVAQSPAEEALAQTTPPTPSIAEQIINNWLNDHPEATTTVQDGSLTLRKFLSGELPFVTPEMFGAHGDGIHDDSNALQDAINTGIPVMFAGKTYLCRDIRTAHVANLVLIGTGGTVIRWNISTTLDMRNQESMISDDGISQYYDNRTVYIRGIRFDGNAPNVSGFSETIEPYALCRFTHRDMVRVVDCDFVDAVGCGLMYDGALNASIDSCRFYKIGIPRPYDGNRNALTIRTVYRNQAQANAQVGREGMSCVEIRNCVFDDIADEVIRADGINALTIDNCVCHNIGHHIVESGHKFDKRQFVATISNCEIDGLSGCIYLVGSDGFDALNYPGTVNVSHIRVRNLSRNLSSAIYKRPPLGRFLNGYSSSLDNLVDVNIDHCAIDGVITPEEYSEMPENNNTSFIRGGNVTISDTDISVYRVPTQNFCISAKTTTMIHCRITADMLYYVFNDHEGATIRDCTFDFGYTFYAMCRALAAGYKATLTGNTIRSVSAPSMIIRMGTYDAANSRIMISNNMFGCNLAGRCINTDSVPGDFGAILIVANDFPSENFNGKYDTFWKLADDRIRYKLVAMNNVLNKTF